MDYTIKDLEGFALITQSASDVTVAAIPLPMGEGFFAFAKLETFGTRTEAVDYVGALISSGVRPEDYLDDDREEDDGDGDADLPAIGR